MASTMARDGKRTAVVERKLVGGSCPNIACLPSKNVIHSAMVASLFGRHREFGIETGQVSVNMAGVRSRKRKMVDDLVALHLDICKSSGAELIFGDGCFTGPPTLQVALRDGGKRTLTAERVFVNVGTHASIPDIAGRKEARPMSHVEVLELDRVPEHLIVLRGGCAALEMSQAMRRFGSRVTLIARGPQFAPREDADVAQAILELFQDEGIEVLNGGSRSMRDRLVPYCLFLDPPLARVGFSESEARSANVAYRVASLPMAEVLRTRTLSEPRGFMKTRILGFAAFGPEAGQLMCTVQIAMLAGQPYMILRDAVFIHPTMSEGFSFLFSNVPSA